jgi:hypothetical protein
MLLHCPDRSHHMDDIMKKFEGRETILVETLTAVFGDEWASENHNYRKVKNPDTAPPPSYHRHEPPSYRTTDSLASGNSTPRNATHRAHDGMVSLSTQSRTLTWKIPSDAEGFQESASPAVAPPEEYIGLVDDNNVVTTMKIAPSNTGMLTPNVPPDLVYSR